MTSDYNVKLEVFEGPLDLLLHLVKKHELDILTIPISFVTEKYLEYLDLMRKLNLDIAGEYLFMAATLAHLKSRELVPSPEPVALETGEDGEEEELDPRQELIRRLLEYQKYKEAAGALDGRPVVGRNVFTRGAPEGMVADENISAMAPLAEVPVFKLLQALSDVLARARINIAHEVTSERLTIGERIGELATRLDVEGTFTFLSCFFIAGSAGEDVAAKHDIVITFLAILEMAKLKLIRLAQPEGTTEIFITRAVPDVAARAADRQGSQS